jgi:hypothetical protein
MTKTYKVTYKTYFNDRLKQVAFHGKPTHPLYIQATFDRKTIFFKSYYFELFSKPRYMLRAVGKKKVPSIEKIISMEHALLDFIIDKSIDNFSLETFKDMYRYFCRDLCDITEAGFRQYLITFFNDKGMPVLAGTILDGSMNKVLYDFTQELKLALKPALHQSLIENSFHYAPPYLPLYGFMIQQKSPPMLILSVMEWEEAKIKIDFERYVSKSYPGWDSNTLLNQIDTWLRLS